MKILFIKLGALGDVINTLPLATHLHDLCNAEITWITESLSYPIVKNHRAVKRTLLFDKKNKKDSLYHISKIIKSEKFDFVFDLQRILKSAVFTIKANAVRKIMFDKKRCKELTWVLPFEKISHKDPDLNHMLDQYLEFSDYIGCGIPDEPDWSIPNFDAVNPVGFNNYVVLNTGATKSANKWFEPSFAKLCDLIFEKTDYQPILTGGPEDIEFSETICKLCKKKPVNITGQTTIQELTLVLKNAEFIITCDTGPMHLGVALGTKTAGLFGPSNPLRTGPYYGKIIEKENVVCSRCQKRTCSNRECMDISAKEVFKAVFIDQWQEKKVIYVS